MLVKTYYKAFNVQKLSNWYLEMKLNEKVKEKILEKNLDRMQEHHQIKITLDYVIAYNMMKLSLRYGIWKFGQKGHDKASKEAKNLHDY